MNESKKNILLITSICMICSYVICYLSISVYNRHCADDFDAIRDVNLYGIFGSIKHCYISWEGSFTQGLVNYPFNELFKNSISLFWYNAITLLCLYGSCSLLVSYITKTFFNLTGYYAIIISGSVLATLFFTSPSLDEVWFWLVGSASYLWPLTFLFLSIYFILNRQKNGYNLILACLFCFLFAGTRLNYPIIIGFFYFLFLLHDFRENKKINVTLLLPYLFLVIGVVIYILAPGNTVRRGYALANISFNLSTVIIQILKGSLRIILYNNLFQLPYISIILSPVLLFAITFYEKIPAKIKAISIKKTVLHLMLLYFGAMLIHTLIMYFALGDAGGSSRTRLLLHLIFCVFIAYIYFLLGLKYKNKLQNKFNLIFSLLLLGCGLFIYKTLHELPINKKYVTAYDSRTETIINAINNYKNNAFETLYLTTLPPSESKVYIDPTFEKFKEIGIARYFLSIPNGSIYSTEIGKRRPKAIDSIIDVYREDQINIRIESAFKLPFRIDLDTLSR